MHQRQRLLRSRAARLIGDRAVAARVPSRDHRIGPGPGGLDLVAAHEQRLVAADHVHDQALIGVGHIRPGVAQRLGETHVERHLDQPHAARARLLDGHPQVMPSSGCTRITSSLPRRAPSPKIECGGSLKDHDLGDPRAQPLAGAQIERRARSSASSTHGPSARRSFPSGCPDFRPRRDSRACHLPRYWPRTMSAGAIGSSARITLSFSSRTASGSKRAGRLHRVRHRSCIRWFCTMSRIAPEPS
jgi:hypothetical protein